MVRAEIRKGGQLQRRCRYCCSGRSSVWSIGAAATAAAGTTTAAAGTTTTTVGARPTCSTGLLFCDPCAWRGFCLQWSIRQQATGRQALLARAQFSQQLRRCHVGGGGGVHLLHSTLLLQFIGWLWQQPSLPPETNTNPASRAAAALHPFFPLSQLRRNEGRGGGGGGGGPTGQDKTHPDTVC
jgi:hypothetical protein